MKRFWTFRLLLPVFAVVLLAADAPQRASAGATTIKGWVSDENCARGRAGSGVFTGTNPECAKKCIASGAKMVLIVSDQRMLLTIANPDAAKANIGDFVEITGSVETKTKALHVDSLKLLTKGVAMCGLPAKK
jgi:hypothetical protein